MRLVRFRRVLDDAPPRRGGWLLRAPLASSSRGIALLMVMVLITMLSIMAVEVVETGQSHYILTASLRDSVKAGALAYSGVSFVGALLKEDLRKPDTMSLDSLAEEWNLIPPYNSIALGDGMVSGVVEDEERKFNIYSMSKEEFACLAKQLELEFDSEGVFELIQQWYGRSPEGDGLEADPYSMRLPPIIRADAYFEVQSELALVEGFGRQNYVKMSPFLTIYPPPKAPTVPQTQQQEAGATSQSQTPPKGMINFNTAKPEVLACVGGGAFANVAQDIVAARQDEPFKSVQDLQAKVPSAPKNVTDQAIVKSSYFSVLATGQVGAEGRQSTVTVETVLRRGDGEIKYLYWKER